MASVFDALPAQLVLKGIFACAATIALLIGFIVFRRWYRGRYFRRVALVALGRTRAPEAVPALAEALNDTGSDPETRMAAIRGLGRSALPEAAVPIIEDLLSGELAGFPDFPVKNALANCCRSAAK